MAEDKRLPESEQSALVRRIVGDYFEYWKQERLPYETEWRAAYDAFMGNYASDTLQKWRQNEATGHRSKVFVRLTKVKVMAALSQIEEFITGIPFAIAPTPMPESMPGVYMDEGAAQTAANAMEKLLRDRLTEAKFPQRISTAALEMAIYGLSFLKGPVLRRVVKPRYQFQVPKMAGMMDMVLGTSIAQRYGRHVLVPQMMEVPTVEAPSVWEFFWDPEGEDIQSGKGVIHHRKVSPGYLLDYIGRPGFDADAIRDVAERFASVSQAGSSTQTYEGPVKETITRRRQTIPMYEFRGRVPKSDLEKEGVKAESAEEEVEIFVLIAGDRVIRRPSVDPAPWGIRPVHAAVWEQVPQRLPGLGIPKNVEDSQTMINGLARCALDNKAFSSNVLGGYRPDALAAGEDGSVYPGKMFELAEDTRSIAEALMFFTPPDATVGLLEMLNMWERFADAESGIPNITHGETSRFDPKTAYAFSQLMQTGTKQMARVIGNIDRGQIQPLVEGFYHYEMATNSDPKIKGDYQVQATGLASFRDRVQDGQNLADFLTMALSNGLLSQLTKIPELYRELAKKRALDRFVLDDKELEEKVAAAAAQLTPPPGMEGDPNAGGAGAMPGTEQLVA